MIKEVQNIMSKEIPISIEDVIVDFLNTVETDAEWVLMNCTEKELFYKSWSDALNFIADNYPAYTERAQQLSQYLDTLFHGDPFGD